MHAATVSGPPAAPTHVGMPAFAHAPPPARRETAGRRIACGAADAGAAEALAASGRTRAFVFSRTTNDTRHASVTMTRDRAVA